MLNPNNLFRDIILCLFVGLVTGLGGSVVHAQNTVGLLSYNPSLSYDGYNLIYPHNQPNVFLLDNCGEIVHQWEDEEEWRPGNTAYILDDGRLLKAKRPAIVSDNPIWAGGGGGTVEMRDWDNALLWSFTMNKETERLHHDIAIIPNGNILMIAWEKVELDALIQAGRDTSVLSDQELWYDKIIEVDSSTGDIVWEWHAWDHLVQDFDETKDNYGVVADNPNKIDLNWIYTEGGVAADWMHANAIDYHAFNNQILLCVPNFSEVWIIDRGDDTAETAGSAGDLRYRWGNPAAYKSGDESDQKLFYPHDAHWNDDFLTGIHPNFDKIIAFNNRIGEDFSAVTFFDQGYDMYEDTFPYADGKFGPEDAIETLTHPNPTDFYSTGLSSAQCLPNGNILMCAGRFGYAVEMTLDQEIVWEYKTPIISGGGTSIPATQGDELEINNNLTFRMNRYPSDYSAFDGKDLSSKGFIELEPNEDFCDTLMSGLDDLVWYELEVFPNPAQDRMMIRWEGMVDNDIEIFDLTGRLITSFSATGGMKYLDISEWREGFYFLRINQRDVSKFLISR